MKLVIITKTKLTTKPISTSFKKLSPKEIDTILSIERGSTNYPWTKKQLSDSISNSNNLSYALAFESQIIGYIIAMPSIGSADILIVTVHKDFKRKGYGSTLILRLLNELSKKNIRSIFLEVRKSNFPAISLYLSLGFKEISVRKNYYTKNSNQNSIKEDGIMMRL